MLKRLIHAVVPLAVRKALSRLISHDLYRLYTSVYRSLYGHNPPPREAGKEIRRVPRPKQSILQHSQVREDAAALPEAFICGAQGLYHLREGAAYKLLSGNLYGLTRHDGWWYIAHRLYSGMARLYRFRWQPEGRIGDWQVLHRDAIDGIHQIDFVGERLYAAIANHNAIAVFDKEGKHLSTHYPLGKLANKRQSPNYAHLNSVFGHDGELYVVAMNITYKTGKRSQLLALDLDTMEIVRTVDDIGNSAHDVLIHDDLLLNCDTMSGILRNHNQPVAEFGIYLRGLALNDDVILVGRSEWVPDRQERNRTAWPGHVYCLDRRNFDLLHQVTIEGIGQVNAIRLLDVDYGLSNTASG
jgi:hypothetical protein